MSIIGLKSEVINIPNWIEVIIRSICILVGLFIITKLLGKKQLSKLSFFEYIAGITIGDIAGTLTMDLDLNLTNGITSILIWTIFPIISSILSLRSRKFRKVVEGNATVLIKDGKVMEKNLTKEKYSIDELLSQLRKKQVFQIADVEFATLEPCGEISVLLKREKQPLTVGDMIQNPSAIKEPQTVIMNGKIIDEPLSAIGLNRGWLKEEIEKLGILTENVFLGQVDQYGRLTVDLYDDKIQMPPSSSTQLLLATIKKCEADFELLALQALSKKTKDMYDKHAKWMQEIKNKVGSHIID